MLRIGGHSFDVTECYLDGFFSQTANELVWGLNIRASSTKSEFIRWCPRITVERLFGTKRREINSLASISPKTISWASKLNGQGEAYGTLYAFEHLPLYNCRVELRASRKDMSIDLTAKCDLYIDGTFQEGVQIAALNRISMYGIWCGKKSEDECFSMLDEFFGERKFKYEKSADGVSVMVPSGF